MKPCNKHSHSIVIPHRFAILHLNIGSHSNANFHPIQNLCK